ncbi:TetR/AcrR family transcriptional regulator [Alicyclobacillus fastidiosus]|uniref:TetR/AcrR family transcriptional regulator n=1 Tax=Alicyclobacillus fastidiosus TaxID=392011 RepID=A0ABV5AL66_9BACL|nr:TetR/AcrR family transcriptional regulator [Alicyclobacillus fastidiosus]WEH08870.1 TetR/AcrR family transcriptional regulator [Alicyclobacillus fastidiosus]
MASRPGLSRSIIVQAAGELADRIGLDKLTLSEVAKHLGVRTPSLYNHIDGMDGLRRELSLLGLQELDRRLQRAALGKAGDQAISAMLQAYRAFAKERPGVYATTLAPAKDDELLRSASDAIIDTVLTVLEPYQLHPDVAIHIVRGFRAIGHGFATLEVANGFGMPFEVEESYERLIATFLLGLCMATESKSPTT